MRKLRTPLLLAVVASAIVIATATSAPAVTTVPNVTTGPATNVNLSGSSVSATLTGLVNPGGQTTTYHFEYGTSTSYGSSTANTVVPAGTGGVPVSATVSGLSASSTYHFRLVATNPSGTTNGPDQTFKPLATGPASGVGRDQATLTGSIDPLGQPTAYYFQFGTTTAYDHQTGVGHSSASGNVAVHAFIGGLQANTTYHYRLVGQSTGDTYFGVDRTFTTGSKIAIMGRMGFVSPGRIIGVELGCFSGTTTCSGHIAMTHNGTLVGQRNFSIPAESGGFQNLQLSRAGAQLMKNNRPHRLLAVQVKITGNNGQTINYVMHLANWVWH